MCKNVEEVLKVSIEPELYVVVCYIDGESSRPVTGPMSHGDAQQALLVLQKQNPGKEYGLEVRK